jgi:hypothetical protein
MHFHFQDLSQLIAEFLQVLKQFGVLLGICSKFGERDLPVLITVKPEASGERMRALLASASSKKAFSLSSETAEEDSGRADSD